MHQSLLQREHPTRAAVYAADSQFYGNNDLYGPDPFHGTHVAGIVAAQAGGVFGNIGTVNSPAVPGNSGP